MPKDTETLPIRVDAELVRRVRVVAAGLGTKPIHYIANKLREAVDTDWPRVLKLLTEEDKKGTDP